MKKILRYIAAALLVAGTAFPVVASAARTSVDWVNQSGTTYIQPNFGFNGMDLLIVGANHYVNFNAVTGASGYGIRDNGGTMEFKNSGGSWAGIGTGSGGGGGSGTISTSSAITAGLLVQSTGASTIANIATSSLGLLTTDVAEGSNLYYTPTRVYGILSATTSLPNITTLAGLSLPYSQLTGTPATGVSSVFTRTGAVTAQSGDYTTAQVTESGNLYYTQARFDAAITATTTLPSITTLANLGTVKTSLSGMLKASSGVLSTGSNGIDFSLITAITCTSGDFVSAVTAAGLFTCSTPSGGGGGGGAGTWATTTSSVAGQLINYPLNSTDIVTVGGSATSTAQMYFNPNLAQTYLNGTVGIGTAPTATTMLSVSTSTSATGSSLSTLSGTLTGSSATAALLGLSITCTVNETVSNTVASNGGPCRNRYIVTNASAGQRVTELSSITTTFSNTGALASTTNAAGIESLNPNTSAGTVTDNYMANWVRGGAQGGTVTNRYGLRIDALTGGTNRWGISQEGSSDLNYFAGNTGVGTTTPYKQFSVGGDAVIGAPTAGGTLGDLYLPKLGTAAGTFLAVDNVGKVIATTTPTGGSGTVTSVAQTVPTGFSITGSPVTTTGTLALSYAAGYSLPLTATTTDLVTFRDTPSTRITAGTNLSWSGNTLNGAADSHYTGLFSATYPLLYSAGNYSIAFGTTTTNAWSNLQTFNGGASTTNITASGTVYASNFVDTSWSGNHCIGDSGGVLLEDTNCVASIASANSSITVSSPTGNVDLSLNLGNANSWTAKQTFANATTTLLSGTTAWFTTFIGSLTGNASTATALAANGTNCSAGSYALGVDASGNSEGCTVAPTGTVSSVAANNGITGGTITTTGTLSLDQSFGAIWTAASTTFVQHLSLNNASTTQFSSPTIWNSTVGNAVWLGDTNGKATAASTQTCTNQFVRAMSAAYVATCAAVSLTADVSGILPIANGGTNASSFGTSGGIVAYDGTRQVNFAGYTLTSALATLTNASTTALSASGVLYTPITSAVIVTDANKKATAASTQTCTNQFVRVMSAAYVATCATVSLTADVTGTLPVGNGGTGAATFTGGQLIYGNTTGAFGSVGTSTIAVSAGLTNTGTLGYQVGGTALTLKQIENRSFTMTGTTTTSGGVPAVITGTTTIPLGIGYGEAWNTAKCFTDTGTLNVDFYHATTHFQFFNASTTKGTVNMAAAVDTSGDSLFVDIGTPASSPTKISCTINDTI